MQGRNVRSVGRGLLLVAAVLVLFSMTLPWWFADSTETMIDNNGDPIYRDPTGDIKLSPGKDVTLSGEDSQINELLFVVLFLTLAAVCIIAFAAAGVTSNKLTPARLLVLAAIVMIAALIMFLSALPGAILADSETAAEQSGSKFVEPDYDHYTNSFSGSIEIYITNDTIREERWGADIGLFVYAAAFVVLVLAVPFVAIMGQQPERRGPRHPRERTGGRRPPTAPGGRPSGPPPRAEAPADSAKGDGPEPGMARPHRPPPSEEAEGPMTGREPVHPRDEDR